MSNDIPRQLSVKELLSDVDYLVPMYQRNYAWDEGEITQLIQDVIDYFPKKLYYIGTLVVFKREENKPISCYETIDGQQRLTTLFLLASYIKNNMKEVDLSWYENLKIDFESREHSRKTFAAIFEGKFKNDPSENLGENEINTAILNGYRLIKKILPQKLKEHVISCQEFANFLFEKVLILQVNVPQHTDLNHYFEIMNSRGEQLEKHEILKSQLLKVLNEITDDEERYKSQKCLHGVWEACANMEKYVQLAFTEQRNQIFDEKDWGKLKVSDFHELSEKLSTSEEVVDGSANVQSIDDIIGDKTNAKSKDRDNMNDKSLERFNSVINFPNFLLHVLCVLKDGKVPLDDKGLITVFEKHIIKPTDRIEQVKNFTFALLKCKYLFDQYVIKREFLKGTRWSLKRFKWNDGGKSNRSDYGNYVNTFGDDDDDNNYNRKILMLLSAFHVSAPTQVYKYWLNAALHYLYYAGNIEAKDYLEHLESIAKAFVFDRFLAVSGAEDFDIIYKNNGACWLGLCSRNWRLDYSDIIYSKEKGKCQTTQETVCNELLKSKLSFGQIENNLIFNYLDYLLWLKHKDGDDSKVKSYEFTFRSSVEHYYPQNPKRGYDPLQPETLNSFGNLCLISHSKNSSLSNDPPDTKRKSYEKNPIDSIKQYLMMKCESWDTKKIKKHYQEMKGVLIERLPKKSSA